MFHALRRRGGDDQDGRIDDEPDGPTASHSGAMISALFLLIFAIAIIVPWTVADSARQNTYAEAQSLVEAYWAAGDLPPAEADSTRAALRDYTRYVSGPEWRTLRDGELGPDGWSKLDMLRGHLGELTFKEKEQKDALDAVEGHLEEVFAARRQRAVDAESSLPGGVLFLTLVTALLVLLLPLVSGAKPRGWVWVPYALLAVCLAVSVQLAFSINHTFKGPLGVSADAFKTAQQEFDRIP
ncbi:hypothetical protein [Actinocorallia longicatena]|uniref:DUF4239 domain-containing protein n=1 Tax=Actinocorallia longicatena TaxID=111803 RepID=A0ABP6QMJ4_9ACTN